MARRFGSFGVYCNVIDCSDLDMEDRLLTEICNGGARFLVLTYGANNSRSPLSSIAQILL